MFSKSCLPSVLALVLGAAVAARAQTPTYEVYAIKYGVLAGFHVSDLVQGGDAGQTLDIPVMFWLLKGSNGRTVLVDSGFYRQKFLDQWKPREFRSPADAVRAAGIAPENVTDVIITHAHWDHVDGVDLFPKATVWIQRDEYTYYTGEAWQSRNTHGGIDPDDVIALLKINTDGRLRFVNGDNQESVPGVRCYLGGRHTWASQYVTVPTAEGTAVVASDNIYLYENIQRHAPIAQTLDAKSNVAAQDRIRGLASKPDLIVPGHDPAVFERYPAAGDGVVRIAPRQAPASAPEPPNPLRSRIEGIIKASGAEVAVAMRTADGRDHVLIDPDKDFHAASTMKVPVMIELFRQVDLGKLSLDDTLPIKNEFHSIVDGSVYQLSVGDDSDAEVYKALGGTMTLRQLCEAMITVSSNFATNLLIEKLGVENIRATVDRVDADASGTPPGMHVLRGVEDQKAFDKGMNNTTTARALQILLLRILQGQAVGPAADGQMAEILKRQKFNDAIPAGVPPGTAVGHKTGNITKIHHDAAIVYGPRPYVLVVLVRGIADEKESGKLIAEISRQVWESVEHSTSAQPRAPSPEPSARTAGASGRTSAGGRAARETARRLR